MNIIAYPYQFIVLLLNKNVFGGQALPRPKTQSKNSLLFYNLPYATAKSECVPAKRLCRVYLLMFICHELQNKQVILAKLTKRATALAVPVRRLS